MKEMMKILFLWRVERRNVIRKKVEVLLLLLVLLPGAKRLWCVKGLNLPILLAEISARENKTLDINDRLLLE
jgi:hypothetical protein